MATRPWGILLDSNFNFAAFTPGASVVFDTLHHSEGNCADEECGGA